MMDQTTSMERLEEGDDGEYHERFQIKVIIWSEYGHETPILLQDINGPCPLIALVNTLVLQNEVFLRTEVLEGDGAGAGSTAGERRVLEEVEKVKLLLLKYSEGGFIGLHELLSQLGDLVLVYLDTNQGFLPEFGIDHLLESLPLLHTGLSVNPDLIRGTFPANDLSSILFSAFELQFRHGWCLESDLETIDGQIASLDAEKLMLHEVMVELGTFDALQDYLLVDSSEDQDVADKQGFIRRWLEANLTQLTVSGLEKLDQAVKSGQFLVFYRNNHFCTLHKRADGEFYALVTDTSFHKRNKNENLIVWQSLTSVSGKDDLFFKGDFTPVTCDESANEDESDQQQQMDFLISKKLQEEEDMRLATEMQQRLDLSHSRRAESRARERDSRQEARQEARQETTGNNDESPLPPRKASSSWKNRDKEKCTIT